MGVRSGLRSEGLAEQITVSAVVDLAAEAAVVLAAAATPGRSAFAGAGGGCERSAGRGPSVKSFGRARPNQLLGTNGTVRR